MNNKLEVIVDDWSLESKLERNQYFYQHENIVKRIFSGKKSYVIGRKGTGKTAICEYLFSQKDTNVFTEKLNFKNFPFNDLYELKDYGYKSPNQYITLWKLVIYSSICKMLIDSDNTPQLIKSDLNRIFNKDIKKALSSEIKRWTGGGFNISILGNGFGGNLDFSQNEKLSWIEKVSYLEDFIKSICIPKDKFIILFDELDEDYKDMLNDEKRTEYSHLLTGLFKAVQDIRYQFDYLSIYPVIFIRDDIYGVIQDPDKTKWDDLSYILEWEEDSIKNLLSYRLSKIISVDNPIDSKFDFFWNKFFINNDIQYGNQGKNRIKPFSYITRNTLLRPRDYVKYIKICSEISIKNGDDKIKPITVKKANKEFSNYLRRELIDEIHSLVPDIDKILDIFSQLRKQTFSIEEFKHLFNKNKEDGLIGDYEFMYILKLLFDFSIIGNQPKQKSFRVFKYKNKEANLNLNENLIIHQGLFRSLQIV